MTIPWVKARAEEQERFVELAREAGAFVRVDGLSGCSVYFHNRAQLAGFVERLRKADEEAGAVRPASHWYRWFRGWR